LAVPTGQPARGPRGSLVPQTLEKIRFPGSFSNVLGAAAINPAHPWKKDEGAGMPTRRPSAPHPANVRPNGPSAAAPRPSTDDHLVWPGLAQAPKAPQEGLCRRRSSGRGRGSRGWTRVPCRTPMSTDHVARFRLRSDRRQALDRRRARLDSARTAMVRLPNASMPIADGFGGIVRRQNAFEPRDGSAALRETGDSVPGE